MIVSGSLIDPCDEKLRAFMVCYFERVVDDNGTILWITKK